MAKKKQIPKRHKLKVGDIATFKFAGSWHKGEIIELTFDTDGHATYTATTSGNGRIYPRLGLNQSKEVGYVYIQK